MSLSGTVTGFTILIKLTAASLSASNFVLSLKALNLTEGRDLVNH